MTQVIPCREDELWSYVSKGDGVICPMYCVCQVRQQGAWCLSDHEAEVAWANRLLDDDEFALSSRELRKLDFLKRVKVCGKPFELVEMLARQYLKKTKVNQPPVPIYIISLADDNRPIEVDLLPLKAYRGAIWRLRDRWEIQVRSGDTPARQRFTIFHEIFHVLAHCRTSLIFKKRGNEGGSFNELLADHFAVSVLMPRRWVKEKWALCEDVNQMAAIFEVPKSTMWFRLKTMGLV